MGWKSRTSCFIATLILSGAAVAHPLGENSVNQYLLVRAQADGIHIGYRLDFAENLAAAELKALDADAEKYLADRGEEWASRVTVTVNGKEGPAKLSSTETKTSEGAGGRKTLLVMMDLVVAAGPGSGPMRVSISVGNYSRVPGWREAAAIAGDRFWIVDADKRVKAKVLDQRAETGERGDDWTTTFTVDAAAPTTRPKG